MRAASWSPIALSASRAELFVVRPPSQKKEENVIQPPALWFSIAAPQPCHPSQSRHRPRQVDSRIPSQHPNTDHPLPPSYSSSLKLYMPH